MLLALEWDSREVRLAVGQAAGAKLRVEQAFALPLPPEEPGGNTAAADKRLGEQIAAILAQHGIATRDALVAVGRTSIELRPMTLPPVPDAELPDMVRLQAPRQFTTIGDLWPVDFVTVTQDPEQPRDVLAATIAPTLLGQIEQICQAAGLTPRRLVLRPFAAAALLTRAQPQTTPQVRLLVDLLAEEADLTAVADGTVNYVRTIRLPGAAHSAEQNRMLAGEIRRTIAAVQHERSGQRVEAIVICGDSAEHAALREQLERDLRMPVTLLDPFSAVELGGELGRKHPAEPGRFAPLFGMLADEAAGSPQAIDFLNPKRRPEPPSQTRFYTLIAAAVAAVVLGIGFFLWYDLDSKYSQFLALKRQNKSLTDKKKSFEIEVKKADSLSKWLATDVNWLDELAALSSAMPPAEEVRITKLDLTSRPSGGGESMLTGIAKSSEVVRKVQGILRDGKHRVRPGASAEGSVADYPWDFRQAVQVLSEEEVAGEAAAEAAAAKKAAASERPAKAGKAAGGPAR